MKAIPIILLALFLFGCPEKEYNTTTINEYKTIEVKPPKGIEPNPVPEPLSILLVGSGLVGLGALSRKRRR